MCTKSVLIGSASFYYFKSWWVGFIAKDREIGELLPSEVWDSVSLVLPLQEKIPPKEATVSYLLESL